MWKQEIEDEIEELREEHEREYKRALLTYEEEVAKYQKHQQAKVCASLELYIWVRKDRKSCYFISCFQI